MRLLRLGLGFSPHDILRLSFGRLHCRLHSAQLSLGLSLGLSLRLLGSGLNLRPWRRLHAQFGVHLLGPRDDATGVVEHPAVLLSLIASLSQGQAEAVSVMLYAHDLNGEDSLLIDDLLRMVDPPVNELGDVDQPLNGAVQPHEGAKRCELGHLTGDDLALAEPGDHLLPFLGLGTSQAEGDLLALLIHLQHVNLHLVTDVEQIVRRLGSTLP